MFSATEEKAMTEDELKEIKAYLDDVGQRLARASDMHRLHVSYGRPPGMTETTWKTRIREDAEHLQDQWKMWRDLKKKYGL